LKPEYFSLKIKNFANFTDDPAPNKMTLSTKSDLTT